MAKPDDMRHLNTAQPAPRSELEQKIKTDQFREGIDSVIEQYEVELTRMAKSDDPELKGGRFVGQEFPISIELAIHPSENGKIIISYSGEGGDFNGYEDKYKKMADYLQKKNVGAVVRMGNPHIAGFVYKNAVKDNLEFVIDHALKEAKKISGTDEPEIYLMGYCAGASAIASIAHKYPQVKKILLIALSGDAGEQDVKKGLSQYKGEVYNIMGEDDDVVTSDPQKSMEIYSSLTEQASVNKSVLIPKCDHRFSGEEGGKILSASTLWAFSDKQKQDDLPNAENGIKLYD